jgi:hypothetical protein
VIRAVADIDPTPCPVPPTRPDPARDAETCLSVGARVDTSVAHPARVYDALLGGKDNYAADRAVAAAMTAQVPTLPAQIRANRAFLHRSVRHLVRDHQIIRFLDIGSGMPTAENVHQIAQRHHLVERHQPGTQVVYVDNDPLVIAHGRALAPATVHQRGRVDFVHADARDPTSILTDPAVTDLLADRRPVALMLVSVLMYFDDTDTTRILSTLTAALPLGSYVVISHPTDEFSPAAAQAAVTAAAASGITYRPRTHEQVLRLFHGLDLEHPGVVPLTTWRPDQYPVPDPHSVYYWAGVGRVG